MIITYCEDCAHSFTIYSDFPEDIDDYVCPECLSNDLTDITEEDDF